MARTLNSDKTLITPSQYFVATLANCFYNTKNPTRGARKQNFQRQRPASNIVTVHVQHVTADGQEMQAEAKIFRIQTISIICLFEQFLILVLEHTVHY